MQVNRAKKYLIYGYINSCLMDEEEKVKSGLIDNGTRKNKPEAVKSETILDQSDQGWPS